jgi:phosphopantetheinyl transferase (holo-ACP synthase)
VPLALLRLWTAKEAFLKAIGCGLDVHPASINVPPAVLRGDPRFSEIGWTESPEAAATFMLIPLPRCEQTLGASAALVVSRNGSIPHITWCDVTSTGRAG